MRKRVLVLFALFLMAVPTVAKIGTIDVVPAATLLIPYFETDPFNPNGVDTLVTIQNASATAIVAHATLWTDYGLPTATFDFYLTGYDQETFSLRGVMNRFVPPTADAADDTGDTGDPNDGISNKGVLSQDINFPGTLSSAESCMPHNLHLAHMGVATPAYFNGSCGARNYGDGLARGYITIDTVNQFNQQTPESVGYFTATTSQNVMLGEVSFVDRPRGRVYTEPAVHIEAAGGYEYPPFVPGTYTFYDRFVAHLATDQREGLPTAWAGVWAGNRTEVEYWRDPNTAVSPFPCGSTPYTLDERQVRAYNANGTPAAVAAGDPFPRAAGVAIGGSQLGLTSGFGWLFMNLNLPAPSGPNGDIRQSWITMRNVPRDQQPGSAMGYSAHGIQLGNAMTGGNPVKP
jgi:hypothetical protein